MKVTFTFKRILFAGIICIAPTLTCSAQDKVWVGHNCEDALALLDNTALEARKDSQTSVIVIARLGTGERSRSLNGRRLAPVMDYLRRKAANPLVGAAGGRVRGYGRIELYVAGKLFYVLAYRRNRLIDCSGIG
jgi:hypothetical protein